MVGALAACAWALASQPGPVQVSREPYRHWPEAWRVSNGAFELVVVPAAGRILRYARVGGANALWEGGDPPPDQYGWPNHGGEKLWIGPQTAWGWPPPVSFDPGGWRVEPLPDGVRLRSVLAVPPGLRMERTVRLANSGSEARIESTIENGSPGVVARAAWHVVQVPAQGTVAATIRTTAAFPEGYAFYADLPASARTSVRVIDGELVVRHRREVGFKLGLPPDAGGLQHRAGSHTLHVSADLPPGGRYPDGGKAWQVASVARKSRYFELEACSPLAAMAPGESVSLAWTWRLVPRR